MKKILLTVLIILLCVLTYFTLAQGIKIAGIQILSVMQIQEENAKLDEEISTTSTMITTQFPQKKNEIGTTSSELLKAKQLYLDKTTSYTDAQILQATQANQYSIEFLLAQVGNHVTKQGVNMKMDIASGNSSGLNNLNFTVNGTYVAITNFIIAIENDTDLNFRIKEFKLVPSSGDILTATFSVKNVKIIGNTSSQSLSGTSGMESATGTDGTTGEGGSSTISSSQRSNEANTTTDTTTQTNTTN